MATVSFRMDDTLKRQTESLLDELGLNMTTAMTMFAKAIVRERRLPLDLSVDPFYSPENQAHLRASLADLSQGKVIAKTMKELEAMEHE